MYIFGNFWPALHSSKNIIVSIWTCHNRQHALNFLHTSTNVYFPHYKWIIKHVRELVILYKFFSLMNALAYRRTSFKEPDDVILFLQHVTHKIPGSSTFSQIILMVNAWESRNISGFLKITGPSFYLLSIHMYFCFTHKCVYEGTHIWSIAPLLLALPGYQ